VTFPLGQFVITTNAAHRLTTRDITDGLRRHASGDWGDLCPEDAALNDSSLLTGDRLLSAYGTGDARFWIITEADRSVTTVLLPEDY
jgi:hypothetical protein